MSYFNYDYSKFEKFGITEFDFKIDIKRAWTCGNANFKACNGEVVVSLESYGLSVGCSSERSQIANKTKALDLIYILLKEKLYKYKEIKVLPGVTIDEYVNELLMYKEKGELVYGSFNGHILYSDKVTLDDAYKQITGRSKEEYCKEIEDFLGRSKKFKRRIPELSKFWMEEGRKVLEEDKWGEWDRVVPIRLNDLNEGISLSQCLDIIKLLNDGKSFKHIKRLVETQEHSAVSFGLLCSMLKQFSTKGNELVDYLND